MEKTKLKDIIQMLQSSDEENATVALAILDTNFSNNRMVFPLLAYKFGRASSYLWRTNAPELYKKISKILPSNENLTFKVIHDYILNNQQEREQIELYMEYLNKSILETLHNAGYQFIKDLKVNLETSKINAE